MGENYAIVILSFVFRLSGTHRLSSRSATPPLSVESAPVEDGCRDEDEGRKRKVDVERREGREREPEGDRIIAIRK